MYNTEMQTVSNPNEVIKVATKNKIKFYEYQSFCNIQKIGSGNFGGVFRANRSNSQQCVALKLFNPGTNIKEIINEVTLIAF